VFATYIERAARFSGASSVAQPNVRNAEQSAYGIMTQIDYIAEIRGHSTDGEGRDRALEFTD
jgi:hypothetical protein